MHARSKSCGTGLAALDGVLQGLLPGDNIVWQVGAIDDYAVFVKPFAHNALHHGRKLIYFRFARHPALLADEAGVEIHHVSPELGFETFTTQIHDVIERAGRGTFYVFDCLSDLAADWYSDLMLGNFFMVTCPYLYDLDTVTYFALRRDQHSLEAVAAIRDTTQVLVDVFRRDRQLYVHPLKVQERSSPTMYLPHLYEDGSLRPLTQSGVVSEVLAQRSEHWGDAVSRTLDIWDRKFLQARQVEEAGASGTEAADTVDHLLRMVVTRDERQLALAKRYLGLADILEIRKRMIGTGRIGGKALGMLLARAILRKTDERWRQRLEPHDSFYLGTDVFYTYLVRNQCWRIRRNQRNAVTFLDGAEEAQQRMLSGTLPPFIHQQFVAMLEYFGQSPIIVRSSSLLEDGFGNAFTGKYESVFCPNQGSPDQRLSAFLRALQTVYASAMSREALLYRARRGLLDRDEQMAVLVQRVSGGVYGSLFFPHIAGVGLSYNPYAWSPDIDPQQGVLRLVFGLGTRAVERADDDYTRVVALSAPLRRPEAELSEVVEHAQHRVDVLDLRANCFTALSSNETLGVSSEIPAELFARRRDLSPERSGRSTRTATPPWVLTFDQLLSATSFVPDMRDMLGVLHQAYNSPVDIEFTANFQTASSYRINLVQCRPLQVREGGSIVPVPEGLRPEDIVLEARGSIVGQSSFATVDRLIYVVPSAYAALPIRDRPTIARLIGRLNHGRDSDRRRTVMLLGPGRWGTSTPSLGVPVSFAEINTVSVLCEIVVLGSGLVPDISLGTHFFNDLVEANMLYLAVYPGRKGNILNEDFFARHPNRLAELLPDDAAWESVVRVIDMPALPGGTALYLNANCMQQRAVCYLGSLP